MVLRLGVRGGGENSGKTVMSGDAEAGTSGGGKNSSETEGGVGGVETGGGNETHLPFLLYGQQSLWGSRSPAMAPPMKWPRFEDDNVSEVASSGSTHYTDSGLMVSVSVS